LTKNTSFSSLNPTHQAERGAAKRISCHPRRGSFRQISCPFRIALTALRRVIALAE